MEANNVHLAERRDLHNVAAITDASMDADIH
jgi:hypothetical protein